MTMRPNLTEAQEDVLLLLVGEAARNSTGPVPIRKLAEFCGQLSDEECQRIFQERPVMIDDDDDAANELRRRAFRSAPRARNLRGSVAVGKRKRAPR
jgi:hypothetical protein